MTRSEAERITVEVFNFQGNPAKAAIDVKWLEKLGVLKLDEEMSLTALVYNARQGFRDSSISQEYFFNYLAKHGYKIVKDNT